MKTQDRAKDESWWLHPALISVLLFWGLLLLHSSLLRLPYFWDEAGYYIPAARDFLLTGTLIPHSTPSNAHPPLVMIYLALCWKICGFAPLTTRLAMIGVSAFSLTGLFYLAMRIASLEVALASIVCTALYPVFFTQSSLAQLDLAAAGFTFWALLAFVEEHWPKMALWFSLAVLTKETAILAPVALLIWELIRRKLPPSLRRRDTRNSFIFLLLPLLPLGLWWAYHDHKTGFVFGNPEFFRYNVQQTLHPLRILLAFLMRAWQAFGYLNLYLLTLSAIFAMRLPPLRVGNAERSRIDASIQFAFLAVIGVYIVALAVVGGAVLARYMLPVVPLVIIVCISTLRRRIQMWRWVVAVVAFGFASALFINPPYGFSLEDNLAYRDYILLHERAEEFIESSYPSAQVLTAWPASDELSMTYLGYVRQPVKVFRVEDFSAEELLSARDLRSDFDIALVFSTKYEPPHSLFEKWKTWTDWKTRFFGYHRDVPPATAAEILGGRMVYVDRRDGQWVGVIEIEHMIEARSAR